MYIDQRHQAPAPVRLLVAVDSGIDSHRLVKLCSDHPQADALTVSLLVPVNISSPSVATPGHAEGMLRAATRLLEWAGVRVEDITLTDQDPDLVEEIVRSGDFDSLVVCRARGNDSSPVLELAIDQARRHGLAVADDGRAAGGVPNWIRSSASVLLKSITPPWWPAA